MFVVSLLIAVNHIFQLRVCLKRAAISLFHPETVIISLLPSPNRFSNLEKVRQKGRLLLTDEVAQGFESTWPNQTDQSTVNEDSIHTRGHTAPSSITELSEERELD